VCPGPVWFLCHDLNEEITHAYGLPQVQLTICSSISVKKLPSVLADGSGACVDKLNPATPEALLCENFYKEKITNNTRPEDPPPKPIPLALVIAPVAGALLLALCAFTRMDRKVLGSLPSMVHYICVRIFGGITDTKDRQREKQVQDAHPLITSTRACREIG
jgi:hypothetical protein